MKDSKIPKLTAALLRECKRAAKQGRWKPPYMAGEQNNHWCPLIALNDNHRNKEIRLNLSPDESRGVMRGYDARDIMDSDPRFYAIGQAFRKISETTGFL